jgi:hypothetical protein
MARVEILPPLRGTHSESETLARLDFIATLLDSAFLIPGTNVRFGLDGVVGLFPGIGDAITTAISAWIVYEAKQLGVPKHVLARMIGNVALDGLVGAVPLVGDVFDVMWKANRRNIKLLRDHLEKKGRA